jgi:hypothetical protein
MVCSRAGRSSRLRATKKAGSGPLIAPFPGRSTAPPAGRVAANAPTRTATFRPSLQAVISITISLTGTRTCISPWSENAGIIFPLTQYPIANAGLCPGGGNTGPICQLVATGSCLSGTTCHSFSFGATPTVSSNGSDPLTAVVWTIEKTDLANPSGGPPTVLHAFRADNLDELYNSTTCPTRDQAGAASKFAVPAVANGLVFVPTQTELDIFGVFSGTPPTCN